MTSIFRDQPAGDFARSPGQRRGPAWPPRSEWLFRQFRAYARRYIRKHFHALRLDRDGSTLQWPPGPLIVVLNHPSWWDPLICLVLTEQMPGGRIHYAPIEVAGLAQYPFLERLGFFGIEQGTPRGGLRFLRRCLDILTDSNAVLWITAQGHFVDPRDRPVRLKPGIGHLAYRQPAGTIVPLALEYPFWNDRCPEALARFGHPIPLGTGERSAESWTALLESALQETQDALAQRARLREPEPFHTLIGGTAGVGGIYDAWRRFRAWLRGQSFRPEHRINVS